MMWNLVRTVVVGALLLFVGDNRSYAIEATAALFSGGTAAYADRRYHEAAVLLRAYLERDPPAIQNNMEFREEVEGALKHALGKVESDLNRIAALERRIQELESRSGITWGVLRELGPPGLRQTPPTGRTLIPRIILQQDRTPVLAR